MQDLLFNTNTTGRWRNRPTNLKQFKSSLTAKVKLVIEISAINLNEISHKINYNDFNFEV